MKIIVGLGNPGEKYVGTRHNIGFMTLDTLLENFEPVDKTLWEEFDDPKAILKKQKKDFARIKRVKLETGDLILAKPDTFMNNSGFAVQRLLSYYKLTPEDMVVIYDDGDLPLGKIRIRFGGGSGGHRGVQNIIDVVGDDKFLRIRLGIGRPEHNSKLKAQSSKLDRYVLGHFEPKEKHSVKHMIKEAEKAVNLILEHGIDTYMSKYNK